jgi:DNA-binding MarR family transcriptional regulator
LIVTANLFIGGTDINKKLPCDREIADAVKKIRSRKYIYVSAFARAVDKYVGIISKQSMSNRTGIAVLTQLIMRGGSLQPTELARLMWLSKHSMTKIIDKFEEDGLISRYRIHDDRRAVLIKVTSFGLTSLMKTLDDHDIFWHKVMNALDEREQLELLKLLKKIVRAFPQDVINANLS